MMSKRLLSLLFLLSCVAAPLARATPAAVVDALLLPATLTRGGQVQPVTPGMEVRNGDRIRTGDGARVYLKLAEGSTVKIGEAATLDFYATSTRPESFYRGAMNVLTGAFRFTTGALAKLRGRDVQVRVGTATIGIRGTDVWGRSNAEKDLVCLIEGHVDVRHPALAEAAELTDALTFFVAPKGAAPAPVGPVDPAQLAQWSLETEIAADAPALRANGKFALALGDAAEEEVTLARYDAARAAGYPVRIRPAGATGGWRYQLVLAGFASRSAALQAAPGVAAAVGLQARLMR